MSCTDRNTMETLRKYGAHTVAKLALVDRRLKLVALGLVVVFVLTQTSIVVANFPQLLWLGKDACAVWRGKTLLPTAACCGFLLFF